MNKGNRKQSNQQSANQTIERMKTGRTANAAQQSAE
jgi:hypothetical protein